MPIYTIRLAVLITLVCFAGRTAAQGTPPRAFKILNVADGLPQSFISGLVQDSTGFIWIGTRDGLARYDGKKFKVFRQTPGDTTTLSSNTIISLQLDKHNRLWIQYETGDIDILNTTTEALYHLTKDPVYRSVYASGLAIAEDAGGNTWLVNKKGGVYIFNLKAHTLKSYSEADLGLQNNRVVGIASHQGAVILATDTALVMIDENRKFLETVPYTFSKPHLYNPDRRWKNLHAFPGSDKIIIQDEGRLLVYDTGTKGFSTVPLKDEGAGLYFCMAEDKSGAIFYYHNNAIYILSPANKVTLWKGKRGAPAYGFVSMLIDNSGVLWMGGNGSGIHLFDLRLSRITGKPYKKSFHGDILQHCLNVPASELDQTFLSSPDAYYFRWMDDGRGKIWLSWAVPDGVAKPQAWFYKDGHIVKPNWHYTDTASGTHANINAMAVSRSGKLWGMDFYSRLVYFDTASGAVAVHPPVTKALTLEHSFTINGLLIDGEDDFWISTALDGLFLYDKKKSTTTHYSYTGLPGSLPTNQLMNMVRDASDTAVLWIGSLGGGLIKFNKITGKSIAFTTRDGLPNNTVYAIVPDSRGMLWCSSNKGVFSFDPKGETVRSFTSKDGLPGDEFNRYHFFKFKDGRIAFGGVDGYTVFDPLRITHDTFQPAVALTGIRINNVPADFGVPASPFKQAINSLNQIVLPYHQNFLTFEFAALEYNIPEKLQYRYKLEGIDEEWVLVGNENTATYTKLPPGNYVLRLNATNTAGQWSNHIKTVSVIILPPFWKTPWFVALCVLAVGGLCFFIVQKRIKNVRKEEQQKAAFEREAAELKAQALRAQMNPHFIFNCLNSIKALIQEDNKRQAVLYLTTFSKLIRRQLHNADREISLYEELETCKLYTQLEALRFGPKIDCRFVTDETVNLHSVQVPPLILQPFIENAIWHGVLPKGGGTVTISVTGRNDAVRCSIEDDGIGRETALRNGSKTTSATHQSKGMKLVHDRLGLHQSIAGRGGSIEVIDKRDGQGDATGTLVIVTLNKEP